MKNIAPDIRKTRITRTNTKNAKFCPTAMMFANVVFVVVRGVLCVPKVTKNAKGTQSARRLT